ncbi:MAG: T9SS type A sorting domain-containing protein [Taibaiella sp.]|nr:T9SS type A sorting domain-containing protein [Taibaiella sp.]
MKNLGLTFLTILFSLVANAALPPITGALNVCEGATTTLSNTVTGGTWTSAATGIATIGAATGIVSGVAAGTAAITYTDGTDFAYATVTVNALPAAITGIPVLCTGSSTTLASASPGGMWSSSNIFVAVVGSTTGLVTGVSGGTTTITYTLATGCIRTVNFTVNPLSVISGGSSTVCVGTSTLPSYSPMGGMYTSSAPAIASVSFSGVITGVSVGTATITYNVGGCPATRVVSVNPAIGTITGTPTVCTGLTTTLGCSTTGGAWTSNNAAVATVGTSSGIVTGVSVGTTTISYHVSGCSISVVVTVSTSPGTITGTATVCAGASTTLSTTSGFGGTWSSSATSVATIGTGGVVAGVASGTSTISYSAGSCGLATRIVTVTSTCSGTPVTGAISASTSLVCSGTPLILNLPTYTYVCGHIIQWQYSTDGLSWTNLPGATTVPYTYTPVAAYYYRCRITCSSSGLSASSGPVFVAVDFSIGTSSIISAPDTACAATHFYVAACGVSASFSVATFFGDGTADTNALSATTLSDAHIYHIYTMPGTYTIKHILYNGTTPVDTVTSSYTYLFCRTLSKRFYKDNNANCVFDAGDTYSLVSVATRVDSNGIPIDTIMATSGFYYKALGGAGTVYAFRPISVGGGLVLACPAGGVIYDTITSFSNTYTTKNFGLVCGTSSSFDLRVNASALSNPTQQRISILVSNSHCSVVSPVVTLSFSSRYGYYSSSYPSSATSPAPSSAAGTTMTWNLSAMAPDATRTIVVYLTRPSTLGTPLMAGDTASYTVSVSPATGDIVPSDNVYTKLDTVRAAYDPNDIAVTPEGYILPCTQLQYKVRFENTGNDTAHNVYVLDTLSDNLDPSTLQVDIASHPMNVTVINDGVRNIAKFDFPNIKLLDTSNRALNNGMFIFKIKARTVLADGTTIPNRVGIYFDYNPVVMTNSVTNTIGIAPIVGPNDVCIGYPATMTNNTPGGFWTSSTHAVATVTGGGVVSGLVSGTSLISYTVFNTCTSRTATKAVTVNPVVSPGVTIAAAPGDTVCSGTLVAYTATPVFGGVSPVYTWRVNGTSVGAGAGYTYAPLAGDTVTVALASSQACAMPAIAADTMPMTVIAMAMPVASIGVSPDDTSCAGTPVTFTATPAFGGDAPGYIWFVNGAVAGTGATHVYVPTSGDVVYYRMGSNFMCRLADTVNSSTIAMTVDPLYIPVVSIAAAPSLTITAGETMTFTASVAGAGPTPQYQWLINSIIVPGATSATFATTSLADYDSVTCAVTGSGVCNVTAYNSVFVTVWNVGVGSIAGAADLHLFPNPNHGGFTIKGAIGRVSGKAVSIEINNVLGQLVYTGAATTSDGGAVHENIQLPYDLANGVYILNMRADNENRMFRFVVDK